MQTTSVYIEHVIIGAEVSVWLFGVLALVDARVIAFIKGSLSFAPALVIFLGFCYVLGIVFDRLFDLVFDGATNKIKKKHGISKETITHEVVTQDYINFHYSRRRIIRGTAVNMIPIGITLFLLLLLRYHMIALALASLLGCLIFDVLSFFAYRVIVDYHYVHIKKYLDAEAAKSAQPKEDTSCQI